MAVTVDGVFGGIRGLLDELKSHGEAIHFDLMCRGWVRGDIGRVLSWREFHHFLRWLPPTADSAYFRSRRPQSWWVTPETQILVAVLHALEGANWQRGGGQGSAPKPMKLPDDKQPEFKDVDELKARKAAIRRRSG